MAISPDSQTTSTPCEWRKISSNEYRRPLFANEIFLAIKSLFDGTCTLISSITIKNGNVADIQDAWRKFPLLMPLVRMQLHRRHLDGKQELEFSYTVPQRPDHELQEWCKSTCKVYEGLDRRRLQDLAVEGRNQLRPTKDQDASDVAHLYVSEDSSGIHMVFIFQHAVTDARGQWRMIDLLLRLCTEEIAVNESSYQWGVDDLSVLPRPFHYAAGLRQDGDIPPFVALEMIHSHIEADTHLMPFAAFPTVSSATPSTSVAEAAPVQSIVIPEEDYKLLHAAAKASDCTASAWVGAVLTILLYELNTVEDAKTIRFPLQPVDARRYVPEGSPNFFGVAIGGGNVDIKDLKAVKSALSDLKKEGPIPGSFWTVSKEYKQGLEKLKNDKDGVMAAKEVLNVICPYVLADPKIGDMASIFYTSLGRARSYFEPSYGSNKDGQMAVTIEDLETFPLFHNTLLMMCSLMEFKGNLKITYQIPNNTYTSAFAAEFGNRLRTILARLVDGAHSGLS